MFRDIYAAVSDEASSISTRIIRLVAGVVIGAAAVIALFIAASRALFVYVAWHHGGPLAGHLAVAGVWLVVAVIAFAIALAGRRKPRRRITTATHDARVQAFESARSVGESISDTITGRRGPLGSRRGLANSVLGALVVGMLIGRRF